MIVRIAGEDQFRLDSSHEARLQELDEAVLQAIERGDEGAFRSSFEELLEFVRASGAVLGAEELAASDVILPPADTTLDEAANDFSGEGWLPD
jgi:PspA-Associated protein